MSLLSNTIAAAERAPLPDALVRAGISALVGRTATRFAEAGAAADAEFAAAMAARAIAEHADAANAQHYEVPAAFLRRCSDQTGNIRRASTERPHRPCRKPRKRR